MPECIEKKKLLKAIEESEPDVMADYGEYYGSEWGISRGKLYEIIANLPTLTPPNEPLTLEQLRGMGGEPVYLKNFNTKFNNGWHILKGITKDEIKFRFEGYMEAVVKTELLGVEFNLYSYPPAHVDREVWMAEWRNHYRSGATAGTGYVCSSCDVWNGRKSHICPSCGKAMDEDGLSELEKRLRG